MASSEEMTDDKRSSSKADPINNDSRRVAIRKV